MKLIIGNKNYSSWSLRPWLALEYIAHTQGMAYEEHIIPLAQVDTKQQMLAFSAAGKVPILILDNGQIIWESLAILEYLAEAFPAAKLWPETPSARAIARCIAAEMHSGFMNLRKECPMNLKRVNTPPKTPISADAMADVARIHTLWTQCRTQYGQNGPFLFGHFTVADAMFAPVATRFVSYGIEMPPVVQAYVDAIYAMPAFQKWHAAALLEPWGHPNSDAI